MVVRTNFAMWCIIFWLVSVLFLCFFLRFRSFAASKYAYIKEFSMKVDKILFEDFQYWNLHHFWNSCQTVYIFLYVSIFTMDKKILWQLQWSTTPTLSIGILFFFLIFGFLKEYINNFWNIKQRKKRKKRR